jgi:hypothetical protein
MHKAGPGRRKTDHTTATEIAKELAVLAVLREGHTFASAAAVGMGASHDVLERRRKEKPEFDEACKLAQAVGKAKRLKNLTAVLYGAAGQAGEDPRFTTALIFALKNLDPENFRDRSDLNVKQEVKYPDTDVAKAIDHLRQKRAAQRGKPQ